MHTLVLCGGGLVGLRQLGVLAETDLRDLREIHAVSAGSVTAVLLCCALAATPPLAVAELVEYVVRQPWDRTAAAALAAAVAGGAVAPTRKGMLDATLFDGLLRGCMQQLAGGLDPATATLADLAARCGGVTCRFTTFDVNAFATVEIPQCARVLDAVHAACAIPGVFEPAFLGDDRCCVDAGFACNMPWPAAGTGTDSGGVLGIDYVVRGCCSDAASSSGDAPALTPSSTLSSFVAVLWRQCSDRVRASLAEGAARSKPPGAACVVIEFERDDNPMWAANVFSALKPGVEGEANRRRWISGVGRVLPDLDPAGHPDTSRACDFVD